MSAAAVNLITLSDNVLEDLAATIATRPPALTEIAGDSGVHNILGVLAHSVLSENEVNTLLADLDSNIWQAVGVDGIAEHYSDGDAIGSWRATLDSQALADILWQRLAPGGNYVIDFTHVNNADVGADKLWRAVGISPRLRCIRYKEGGLLVPHYDAPYDYEDGRRTLRSVVLYLGRRNDHQGLCVRSPIPPAPAPASALALTSRQRRHKQLIAWGEAVDTSTPRKTHHLFVRGRVRGGATRFLIDPQAHLSYAERDFSDWTRLARADEVLAAVEGVAGDALIFNHRILHDSEPLVGAGTKTIIRSDIIFERVRPNS